MLTFAEKAKAATVVAQFRTPDSLVQWLRDNPEAPSDLWAQVVVYAEKSLRSAAGVPEGAVWFVPVYLAADGHLRYDRDGKRVFGSDADEALASMRERYEQQKEEVSL